MTDYRYRDLTWSMEDGGILMKNLILFLFAALVIVSCGSNEKQISSDGIGAAPPKGIIAIGGDRFSSTCQDHQKQVATINSANVVFDTYLYDEADCSGQDVLHFNYHLEYLNVGKSFSDNTITKANFVWKSGVAVSRSSDWIDFLNTQKVCGKTDWKLNENIDLMGSTCVDGFKIGETMYSIYRLVDKQLKFGVSGLGYDGRSSATRHVLLDATTLLGE